MPPQVSLTFFRAFASAARFLKNAASTKAISSAAAAPAAPAATVDKRRRTRTRPGRIAIVSSERLCFFSQSLVALSTQLVPIHSHLENSSCYMEFVIQSMLVLAPLLIPLLQIHLRDLCEGMIIGSNRIKLQN